MWFTSVPLPNEPGVKATLALASNAVAVPIVGADGGVGAPAVKASTSEIYEYPSGLLVTLIRMRSVVTAAKLTVRLTRLLPVIVACVTQADPFQVCTVKPVMPYSVNVMLSVGSDGLA